MILSRRIGFAAVALSVGCQTSASSSEVLRTFGSVTADGVPGVVTRATTDGCEWLRYDHGENEVAVSICEDANDFIVSVTAHGAEGGASNVVTMPKRDVTASTWTIDGDTDAYRSAIEAMTTEVGVSGATRQDDRGDANQAATRAGAEASTVVGCTAIYLGGLGLVPAAIVDAIREVDGALRANALAVSLETAPRPSLLRRVANFVRNPLPRAWVGRTLVVMAIGLVLVEVGEAYGGTVICKERAPESAP